MKLSHVFSGLALLLAGATATQFVRADAQANKAFGECVSVRLWSYSGDDTNEGKPFKKTVRIPTGWTVVGGGGSNGEGIAVLCR